MNAASSPAEQAAFRAAVRREDDVLAERVEARMTAGWTPREERLARDLERMWREATWINVTGQFPDGRPMNEQPLVRLAVWGTFLAAINRRMWGGKSRDDDPEEPAAATRDGYPTTPTAKEFMRQPG